MVHGDCLFAAAARSSQLLGHAYVQRCVRLCLCAYGCRTQAVVQAKPSNFDTSRVDVAVSGK